MVPNRLYPKSAPRATGKCLETAGVDFTNVLRAAFTHEDPKSEKRQ